MTREIDLVGYLPPYLKEYRELVQTLLVQGKELEDIWEEIDKILNNAFIATADADGLPIFEQLLNVDTYGTLEERRFRCRAKWNENKNYTLRWLREQLDILCGKDGYVMEVIPEQYFIYVKVALVSKNNEQTIRDMLSRILPQNMMYKVSLIYNKHRVLGVYTHRGLSLYTHNQLRNEVLSDE